PPARSEMEERLAALVDASRRHAAAVTLILLLLAAAGAWFTAGHISIDSDVNKLINPALPWRQREAAMDKAFPQNDNILAVVIDGATSDLATDAAAALTARLTAMPTLFSAVREPEGGPFFQREGILFLPTAEVQEFADQMIAAQPLIGTLAADPSIRGVFGALDLLAQGAARGDIAADKITTPLAAVSRAVEAALAGRYAPLSWQTLLSGRTPEKRELRRFVLAKPVLDYAAIEPGAAATDAVHQAARALGFTPERGVSVRITGPVALNDDQFATLSEGAGFTTILSLALLCLWLILATRSPRLVLSIIATLLVGLVACATFATGAVGPLNPISAAFAVLFVGLAVDFCIQFSVRYRDERYRSNDLAAALHRTARGIGGPLAAAAAATAVGFFSFVPTDYSGVSELGLIAGVGMLLALALSFTLLPALLALLRPGGEPRPVGLAWAAPVDRLLVRHRGIVIALAGLAALGALALMPRLTFDFNPLDLQNQTTEAMRVLNELKTDPDATPYTAEILAPSLAAAQATAARLDQLPEVGRTITLASFIPDDQKEKLAILADAASLIGPTLAPPETKPAPSDAEALAAIATTAKDMEAAGAHGIAAAQRFAELLRQVLARGAAVLPALKANLATGLENRLGELRQSLAAEPVSIDTLPPAIRSEWATPDGRARVEVFPKGGAPDNAALQRFAAAVTKVAPDAVGSPVTIIESANAVTRAFEVAGAIAVVAIAALLLVVLRRVRDVVMVLAPLALAGLMTLATGVLLDMPLNFANIITLPLLLGIGVAFDIYFVMRWRSGQGELLQSSTARAILFSALTTGTAFGSLTLSSNLGMSEMGKLLSLALFYTLVCTLFVLPAFLGPVRDQSESP
ncbi:MAG TPA: MMPL family transporter, partial [Stellaceae bacterium]|nr:MMPL family transporter [Stellaceae bacterium]